VFARACLLFLTKRHECGHVPTPFLRPVTVAVTWLSSVTATYSGKQYRRRRRRRRTAPI